jgi:hypothetical protein
MSRASIRGAMTIPEAAQDYRPNPDQEALELLVKLADRIDVARSFARICKGLLQERAARASVALAPRVGELAGITRFARAAADAAKSVAANEVRRVVAAATPEPRDNEPVSQKKPKQTQNQDDEAPSSLDHEALHDDAC